MSATDISWSARIRIAVISDIHYAGADERARGDDYELRIIHNPLLRTLTSFYRHHYWMRHPLEQGRQLDRFLALDLQPDFLVANGDYTCDTAFVGVSDDAAAKSVQECTDKIRARFGEKIQFVPGDHDFGKLTLFGGLGGMRLQSWHRATGELGLNPFWKLEFGNYFLLGVTSSLIALPAHQNETLPAEFAEWQRLRENHLAEIRAAFDGLRPEQRVILFCHDPTALPFLWREEIVRRRLPQVELTVIGHLHTRLILWKSRLLSGLPPINFLGASVRKLSTALSESHLWKPFHVQLCPSLAGCQLLNDGGYCTLEIDPAEDAPAQFIFHPLPR